VNRPPLPHTSAVIYNYWITVLSDYSTQQCSIHKRKTFHNKPKIKQYVTTKPALQKILEGILDTEDKAMKGWE
jgi:hypothetical protein